MSTGMITLISKLELNELPKRLKPVDHFKKCPCCEGKEMYAIGPDLVCLDCCWDSTAWDVNQGGMDNVFTAAREYGFTTLNAIPTQEQQNNTTEEHEEKHEENQLIEIQGA